MRPLLMLAAAFAVGCSGGGPRSPDFLSEAEVESLTVSLAPNQPANAGTPNDLPIGRQLQLRALATISRAVPPGTKGAVSECPVGNPKESPVVCEVNQDVTQEAAWSSTDNGVATVERGRVTGRGLGVSDIVASLGGKSSGMRVTVTPAVLERIAITREGETAERTSDTLPNGGSRLYRAVGFYSGSSTPSQLNGPVTWVSEAPSVATVTPNAQQPSLSTVRALSIGSTAIAASFGEGSAAKSATMALTVNNAQLIGIRRVRPDPDLDPPQDTPTVYVPLEPSSTVTKEFIGIGMVDRQDRTRDFALNDEDLNWSSGTVEVATIDAAGVATILKQGTTVITGQLKDTVPASGSTAERSATATLVVTDPICTLPYVAAFGATAVGTTDSLCLTCTVTDPNRAIDSDTATAAVMNVPVGLLGNGAHLTVTHASEPIPVGARPGFLVTRPANTPLSAELLSRLTVTTFNMVNGTLTPQESTFQETPSTVSSVPLRVTVLGQVGGLQRVFVGFAGPVTKPAEGVRLSYNGTSPSTGLASALPKIEINSACRDSTPQATQ